VAGGELVAASERYWGKRRGPPTERVRAARSTAVEGSSLPWFGWTQGEIPYGGGLDCLTK